MSDSYLFLKNKLFTISAFLTTFQVSAGSKGDIDPTYFKATMEYRQRTGLLLEAALRVAMSVRSYRLAKTIIETVSMFKVGCPNHDNEKTVLWFRHNMAKQYGGINGLPKLLVGEKKIENPDEKEIATEDICSLTLDINRTHAENFTKQKLALCMKQGIPPEVALNSYREGWWIMIRCERLSGIDGVDDNEKAESLIQESNEKIQANELFKNLDASVKKRFEDESYHNRLLLAWPFVISNVAQKAGKVKVRFIAPQVPGKYKFFISIKSQEFLGTDQEFVIEQDVLDKANVERKEKVVEPEAKKSDDDGKEEDKEVKKTQ
uniref:SEC63 domain-containing protein n=1 Tax=Eucampia antarctica TaxID=49252 RepID=A0A7S2RG29_9STRA|mmetsp:Transcript_21751/g.20888  ORF Transcript_21751/g.20888 Transcript_21751/m.20888 type:complete len:320 (+) Transcript_21751:240-1199(+)